MATLREIKGRISSVKNTEKITRAMKMVAAVKFRRAQEAILSARPYARRIDAVIKYILPSLEEIPGKSGGLLKERDTKRIALAVVTSDRGLCGSFNTNLIKAAQALVNTKYSEFYKEGNLPIIAVGKKSFDYFSKRDFDIYAKYAGVFDGLNYNSAKEIVADVISGYREKKFDKIIVIYNEFKSVIQSNIIEEQFLPILSFNEKESEPKKEEVTKYRANYIFEPGPLEIIDYLLPKHLNTQIWRILLESNAAEQAARMTAMDSATRNANDLISFLQLSYNKARQAAITKEILEVVGGAEALRETV